MKLIDTYVSEVGRHLPAKNREDIEKEIRSMIEDMLEDQTAGQEPAEDQVVEVLQKLGPPDKVAASYQPPRYLIGPELFPAFVTTIRIVLAVTLFLSLLGIGVSIGQAAPNLDSFLETLIEIVADMVRSLFSALGVVVVIFALLQWFAPKAKTTSAPWDPRKMKPLPDNDRVKIGDAVTEIVFSALAIIVFNFFPQIIGFGSATGEGEALRVTLTPVLTDSFFRLLPWFNLVWGLEIVFNLILIGTGRWKPVLRWVEVAMKVLGFAVGYALITAEPLFAVTLQGLVDVGWSAEAAKALTDTQPLLYSLFRIAIGIGMAVGVFELGKKLYDLLLKERMSFASIEG